LQHGFIHYVFKFSKGRTGIARSSRTLGVQTHLESWNMKMVFEHNSQADVENN